MVHHANESSQLPILGDSQADRDEWHSRSKTRFLARIGREMKFLKHGKAFPDDINTMHDRLGKIHGCMEVLSPELSKEEIEKKSQSTFLLECRDVISTPSQWIQKLT
jgi:hypothetical protein